LFSMVVLPSWLPPAAVASRTHHPPYEQLLIGMGVGAAVLGVVIWPCWWWCHSALSSLSYGPGAPVIHPTSSGSSAWLWVLCCLSSPVRLLPGAGARMFSGPGTPCCCPGIVGMHHHCPPFCCRHQHRSTHHPPHEQLLMGLEAGGVWRCWVVRCGVLGPFLVVVGACCHPLTLPNLQAGACSGGNGWWVGIVAGFCLGGG
jgi:hypothetical protein